MGFDIKNWKDTKLTPEERAQNLLEDLSLEEKMAQINCICAFGDGDYLDMKWFSDRAPYGIGEIGTLEMRRIKTLKEAGEWQRSVQKCIMNNSPHHIPAIFHMEGICGPFIQGGISFPSGIARGSAWNPELEKEIARITARQETACGITHILSPILDISRDARMGRQGESYGEDPTLTAALGAAFIEGTQEVSVAGRRPESVAKHFLAFHNSQGGIHGTHSDTPPRLLREIYGKPFQAAIQNGLKGIMPCYCSIDGEPSSVSQKILTGLLRDEMGFEGVCISDYGGINNAYVYHHVGETLEQTGYMALSAGMDIEMPNTAGYGPALQEMFRNGTADLSILNQAVHRILTVKFRMGLFEHPFALEEKELNEYFGVSEDRLISLQSAKESIILLKNDGVLPLNKKIKRIALIGPHAECQRKFFGGYTHMCMMESTYAAANSIAGVNGVVYSNPASIRTIPGTNVQSDEGDEFDEILKWQKPDCESLLSYLKKQMPDTEIFYSYGYPVAGKDESGFEEALAIAEKCDLIILTLGGKHGTCSLATMGEGVDSSNINLPQCQESFLCKVAKLGKPMVGVHFDGRPISSDAADQYLNAILEAWSPAECGAEAVAGTLLGDYSPSGKLPISVAYHAGQIPVYYNHPCGSAWHQGESIGFVNYVDLPHRPRYCFGYGLSYTDFMYDNFEISTVQVRPFEEVCVSVDVCNVGKMDGDEIVQLYVSDCHASCTRPVQEMIGFKKIHLNIGEKKNICFHIYPSQFAFLDRDMRWKIEKGDFEIRIGTSSENIQYTTMINITEDAWIDGKTRVMWTRVTVSEKERILE